MSLDTIQPDVISEEQLRRDRFETVLWLMEEYGADMIVPARPELCQLRTYKDLEDPEQENSRVALRFDTLPEKPRKICRLTASLCRLILAAPLFVTPGSHDARRGWRNSITQLPRIGPYADLMYRGNALRPNMVASVNSMVRMLEKSVLAGDDIPPQIVQDIADVCAQWRCPGMLGYLNWEDEAKVRVGTLVREQAERLLGVLTHRTGWSVLVRSHCRIYA